ncbi:MAG TPA: hypothetical protein VMB50_18810 [Myxococcales bacterium]|nr:hypothetical protein [Myxococcales bacterium]
MRLGDNEWHADLDGCDSTWGASGLLTREGNHWLAVAVDGKPFEWPGLGYGLVVRAVRLDLLPDGSLQATGRSQPVECVKVGDPGVHGGRFQQLWKPGRVCAVCGGPSPPGTIHMGTAELVACDGGRFSWKSEHGNAPEDDPAEQ